MIGTISGESLFRTLGCIVNFCASVRAKIRDGADGHSASANYWLRCLYEGEKGNPEDVEEGFLKGELLVKVRLLIVPVPCASY